MGDRVINFYFYCNVSGADRVLEVLEVLGDAFLDEHFALAILFGVIVELDVVWVLVGDVVHGYVECGAIIVQRSRVCIVFGLDDADKALVVDGEYKTHVFISRFSVIDLLCDENVFSVSIDIVDIDD